MSFSIEEGRCEGSPHALIDDIRIYDRALTATTCLRRQEVKQLYKLGQATIKQ